MSVDKAGQTSGNTPVYIYFILESFAELGGRALFLVSIV